MIFFLRECAMICFAPSVCPLAPRATILCTKYKVKSTKCKMINLNYKIKISKDLPKPHWRVLVVLVGFCWGWLFLVGPEGYMTGSSGYFANH